jgi:hypothetical protein
MPLWLWMFTEKSHQSRTTIGEASGFFYHDIAFSLTNLSLKLFISIVKYGPFLGNSWVNTAWKARIVHSWAMGLQTHSRNKLACNNRTSIARQAKGKQASSTIEVIFSVWSMRSLYNDSLWLGLDQNWVERFGPEFSCW